MMKATILDDPTFVDESGHWRFGQSIIKKLKTCALKYMFATDWNFNEVVGPVIAIWDLDGSKPLYLLNIVITTKNCNISLMQATDYDYLRDNHPDLIEYLLFHATNIKFRRYM